jgi:hypothetical protein
MKRAPADPRGFRPGPATARMLEVVKAGPPPTGRQQIIVGVDECMAGQAVEDALRPLVAAGIIDQAMSLWWEVRTSASGEMISTHGGAPVGLSSLGVDFGHRRPGDRCSDAEVASFAVAELYSECCLVLLTENRRDGPDGLRPILHREVGPLLNADTRHGRSLIVLLRMPRTPLPIYIGRAVAYLRAGAFPLGFAELKI